MGDITLATYKKTSKKLTAKPQPRRENTDPAPLCSSAAVNESFDLVRDLAALFQKAFDLLEDKGWARGKHCLDAQGIPTHHADRRVVAFDLYGAICFGVRGNKYNVEQKDQLEAWAFKLLRGAMPAHVERRNVVAFNVAATNKEQVLDLLRNAALQIGHTIIERNAVL